MSCNCDNSDLYKSTASVEIDSGNTFNLIIPTNALTPTNTDKISILITKITSVSPTLPVYITLNGSNYQVLDKYGNIIYGAELRTRICLRGYYGTNGNATTPQHFQLVNFPYGR